MTTIEIYFDGASKGNPGPSSYGYVIKYSNATEETGNGFIGTRTNNEAEYTGLIESLKKLVSQGHQDIVKLIIYGDSKLVIEQMAGNWKINAENLKVLKNNAQDLIKQLKQKNLSIEIKWNHILRNLNAHADKLANMAINNSPLVAP
jgi:ribonuclease HI